MTNNWTPPGGTTPPFNAWPPPQPKPQQQGSWTQQATTAYQPTAYQPAAWPPPQQGGLPPDYWMTQKSTEDRVLEWVIPINRSGMAIAAGYVSLFSIFAIVVAPVGLILGLLALRDLRQNPTKLGKGRAWFAIIFGGILTAVLLLLVAVFLIYALRS